MLPAEEIEHVVDEARDTYADAKVPLFLPILVKHQARERLDTSDI